MTVKTLIKKSEYHDSVSLMLVARELSKLEGVRDAAVVMGTEANQSILSDAGLLTEGQSCIAQRPGDCCCNPQRFPRRCCTAKSRNPFEAESIIFSSR